MYIQFLVALEYHEVMPVAFVITEKQILAVSGINIFPIFKGQFDCREGRMSMELIGQVVIFEEFQDLINSTS